MQEIEIGKGRKLKEGKDIAVITLGPIGVQAEKAIKMCIRDRRWSMPTKWTVLRYPEKARLMATD